MKTKLSILLIFLLLSLSVSAQEGDTLFYNKRGKLTLADFRGNPNIDADSIRSFLSVTLQMRHVKTNVWMGYGTYEAHAMVFKNKSWMKVANDTSMLRYQQYAFEMTELVAKKLEKEVNEAKINMRWINKINKIFEKYDQYARQCLRAYETETHYGLDNAKRTEWEAMIDKDQLKLEIENSRK